jgi:hypothetical protein
MSLSRGREHRQTRTSAGWLKAAFANAEPQDRHADEVTEPWPKADLPEELEPRIINFFFALPDPLPFPHHTIYSLYLEREIPELREIAMHPTKEQPPLSEDFQGRLFVSLRFWQLQAEMTEVEAELRAEETVMKAALPREVLGQAAETEGEIFNEAESKMPETYRTVVDAVTLLLADDADPVSDAFDRCLHELEGLVRAYRVAHKDLMPYLTRERLSPVATFITRDLAAAEWDESPSALLLHMNIRGAMARGEPLSDEEFEKLNVHREVASAGHPLFPYAERMLDARRLFHREGDTANAVIFIQLALEVFLDGILTLMLWEEGADPEEAGNTIFAEGFAKRVRTYYAERLGGTWDPNRRGPVRSLLLELAPLRGRVVHASYVPSREETRRVFEVAEEVDDFAVGRLIARRNRFMRTVLLSLGQPGLEKRGLWAGQIRAFAERAREEPDWLVSYRAWREALTQARQGL